MSYMRAIVNGKEGGLVTLPKASDAALNVALLNQDGSPHALSTATVDAVFYDYPNRKNAAIKTVAATINTAADGNVTVTLARTDLTFGPGTYYLFLRKTLSGAITLSKKYTVVKIV